MKVTEKDLYALAKTLGQELKASELLLSTAESCTGGWAAKVLTDIEGCSAWFERGFVTYTNASKHEMLSVSASTLEEYGAVSKDVVTEMAHGAIEHSHADLSFAITGIAGPGGGSNDKPVGTVWFAWSSRDGWLETRMEVFTGDRQAVRMQAVQTALQCLLKKVAE